MFNDVHLAKVSRINKTLDWQNGAPQKNSKFNSQCTDIGNESAEMLLNLKKKSNVFETPSDSEDVKHKLCEHGFNFETKSPCCCAASVEDSFALDKTRNIKSVPILHFGEPVDCLLKDNNESDNNISSCSTLDIVNKVEHLSLHELETHLKELSQRLRNTEIQRDELQNKLDECTEEKELCYRRLDVITTAHESRITEMHCVIAELSKKLRMKQETTILEENEPEGSEISYQEESVCNSEVNLTNPDANAEVDCDMDPYAESAQEDLRSIDVEKDMQNYNDSVVKSKLEVLQEEVLHLRAQIALLQSEIAEGSKNLTQEISVGYIVEEKQNMQYFEGDIETDASNSHLHTHNDEGITSWQKEISEEEDDVKNYESPEIPLHGCVPVTQKASMIVPKMAEKVKLRHSTEKNDDSLKANHFINSEISGVVDNFVANFLDSNNRMESLFKSSDFEEFQKLHRKIEHLKMHNLMLSLTMSECKEHCEQLYLLCGKYESNAIALQSAVNCSDRAIEAYDVMLALLESKMVLMKERTEAASESRKAVESVARNLLLRLDSEKNLNENSLGPWKNTFNFTDKSCKPWTAEDDNRLRYHVSKLKGRRSTVQNTIVNLESPFSACYEKSRMALEGCKELNSEKDAQVDIETAVLMQELLNLREENIQLKSKAEEAEQDRQFAVDKINILQEDLQQLQQQLATDSDVLFKLKTKDRESYSESDHAALTERQLVEALTRESELKSRIQSLLATVSDTRKSSNEKYIEVQNNIKDLQKINMDLTQALENNKRKYQARTRKLEQKIAEMSAEIMQHRDKEKIQVDPRAVRRSKTNLIVIDNVPETIL